MTTPFGSDVASSQKLLFGSLIVAMTCCMVHFVLCMFNQFPNLLYLTLELRCLNCGIYFVNKDWFHYFLVYDPQQKTLVADRGEMGIGTAYQAQVPKKIQKG